MIIIGTLLMVTTNYLFFPNFSIDLIREVTADTLRMEAEALIDMTTAAVKGDGCDVQRFVCVCVCVCVWQCVCVCVWQCVCVCVCGRWRGGDTMCRELRLFACCLLHFVVSPRLCNAYRITPKGNAYRSHYAYLATLWAQPKAPCKRSLATRPT